MELALKARLNIVLSRSHEAIAEAIDELVREQRSDGGWEPLWAAGSSSVDATCYRLAHCEQLGLTDHELIRRAISFLMTRQQSDGSFEEWTELAAVAPPWAMPGDIAARIYLTAHTGFWIRYYQPSSPALPAVRDFLTSHVDAQPIAGLFAFSPPCSPRFYSPWALWHAGCIVGPTTRTILTAT